jgi:hypothetical protein
LDFNIPASMPNRKNKMAGSVKLFMKSAVAAKGFEVL